MSDTRCKIHGIRRCTICAPSIPPGELADQATRTIDALPPHLRVRYVVRERDGFIVDTVTSRDLSFDQADALARRHGFSLFDV